MLFNCFLMLFALQPTLSTSSTFLEMAKKNPAAFIDLVDMADHGSIKQIIVILQGMITELETKNTELKRGLNETKTELNSAMDDEQQQEKKCITLGESLKVDEEKKDFAAGEYQTVKKYREDREPILVNETATLTLILRKVETLLTSPELHGRRLLSLDTETIPSIVQDPKSFLDTLTGADPDKVNEVISLLQFLISEANSELDTIITNYNTKLNHTTIATQEWKVTQTAFNICEARAKQKGDHTDNLEAILDAKETEFEEFTERYTEEKQILQEIIDILEGMLV